MGHGNGKASPKNNARSFSETLIRAICEADFEMLPTRSGQVPGGATRRGILLSRFVLGGALARSAARV